MNATRITNVTITPVAFRDPPLLNAVGLHEPFAVRSILEVETSDGVIGLGESYGDAPYLDRVRVAADALRGVDVFATNEMLEIVARSLGGVVGSDRHGLTGQISAS